MRRLLLLALTATGSLGCVAFPHAQLSFTEGLTQQISAPVVCGPMGFRKTPLQARWGEYVRVTVSAAVTLRGTALLHANGQTFEPRAWSTDRDGNLVLEARFENLDPDARFALSSERPIDITLSALEAPAGGSCEGAVFTVEQGALVPSISEAAWLAELERRGGPELAARRAAARAEVEARREAHYAAWAQRREVEVSAELIAQADATRLAHYAAWDARRWGQVQLEAGATASVEAVVEANVSGEASASAEVEAPAAASTGADAAAHAEASSTSTLHVDAHAEGTTFAGVGASSSTTVLTNTNTAGFGAEASAQATGAVASGGVEASSGTCGVPVASAGAGAWVGGSGGAAAASAGAMSCVETTTPGGAHATVMTTSTEAVQGSTRVGADVAVSAPTEWASFEADVAWSQPADAQLRATHAVEWEQPSGARLDAVAVNTESKVSAGAAPPMPPPAPVVTPMPACTGGCGADVGVSVALPAFFHVLSQAAFIATAGAPAPPPPPRVHRAVPVGR